MKKPKKSANSHLLISLLLLFSCLLPSMAISGNGDAFLKLPAPSDFHPALQADGSPQYITAATIEATIKRQSREFSKLYRNKEISRYIVPRHDWLKDLVNTYETLLYEMNIKGEAETWDCENYSQLLNALTTVRIWKAGYYDTRAAIGWLKVYNRKSWAGIPVELHALIFAVTEDGFYIIEPQNGQTIRLEDYPNRHFIREIYLF